MTDRYTARKIRIKQLQQGWEFCCIINYIDERLLEISLEIENTYIHVMSIYTSDSEIQRKTFSMKNYKASL